MTVPDSHAGRRLTRKVWLIAGCGLGLIVLSCCSLWTVAIGPPIPWSKRYFQPTDSISAWEAKPDRERLVSQASTCGLVWSSTIRGTKESQYESGPEYRLHLTPLSFDQRQIESWELKSVRVFVLSRADELLVSGRGDGLLTGDPTIHPSMEGVAIYNSALVLIGTLDSVRPGELIEVIADVEVRFHSEEPACTGEVRIEFECVHESGWLRVYR